MSTERVDLREAEVGDELLMRDGDHCRYDEFTGCDPWCHRIRYPSGGWGSRRDSGHADCEEGPQDIVENLSLTRRNMSKPRPSFVLFGGAIVGSDPVPVKVDPLADLKAAWMAGKRVRICTEEGGVGEWKSSKTHPNYFSWSSDPANYQIEPDPVPVDPYARLRQALRDGKMIECNVVSHGPPCWWACPNPSFCFPATEYRVKPEPVPVAAVGAGRIEWPKLWLCGRKDMYRAGYDHAVADCKAAVERAKL